MPAKRQRPARLGPDRGAVLGEGKDRATAEQQNQTHAVQAGMWCLSMDTEEIQGFPSKRMCLGCPVHQKHQSVFPESLPFRLRPVRVRGHGEKVGDAVNPIGWHAVRDLEKNGAAAGWAGGDAGSGNYFA